MIYISLYYKIGKIQVENLLKIGKLELEFCKINGTNRKIRPAKQGPQEKFLLRIIIQNFSF